LLVSFGKCEWHWSREVFRLDASGTLIKKYGSGEPKGDISGDPDGCGDGLCLATSMNDIQVYDGAGEKVGSVSLREQRPSSRTSTSRASSTCPERACTRCSGTWTRRRGAPS